MLEGDKVNLDKVACAKEVLDEVIIHLEKEPPVSAGPVPEQVDSSLDKEAADAQRELEGEGVQK